MSNLAQQIVVPIRPDLQVVEQRVADLDDGYTRLANELLDAAMCSGLPETELCILMAVWRKTYGYNKKMDWISNEQLEEMIKKHHTHCSTAKNNLIRKKVLIQEGRRIGMNKNVSEWQTKNNGFCKTLAKPAKKTLAEVAKAPKQKLLNTKDNNTKDKKDNTNKPPIVPQESNPKPKSKPKAKPKTSLDAASAEIPEWLSRDTWLSWVSYRKEIGKTIKSAQTITQAINTLMKSREIGYHPEEIINQSIASGWVGIFVPKQPKAPTKHVTKSAPENFSGKDYGQTDIPAWAEQP